MTQQIDAKQPLIEIPQPKQATIFTRARVAPYNEVREFAQFKAQVRACREIAAGLGAAVVSVYEARGGTSDPRVQQAIEQLLAEVDRAGITYVIATNLDRLARRPRDLARIVRRLSTTGARLVTNANPAESFLQDVKLFCLVAKENERRSA